MTATYATTEDLAKFMNLAKYKPDRTVVGSSRGFESVGTGGSSATQFFLDNANVIADTYELRYGTSGTTGVTATALTNGTHYTLDLNNGEVSLTTDGITAVGTNTIYAKYGYAAVNLSNDQLQESLNRAQDELDSRAFNHWANGTDATPDYIQVTNEKKTGKGQYNRDYFTDRRPIPDVSSTLSSTIASGASTATVVSTNGFLSSGVIGIGSDKITYTSKSSTEFLGCSGISSTHNTSTTVYPYVFEQSTTGAGSTPTWVILSPDDDYDLVRDTGKVHIYRDEASDDSIYLDSAPLFLVPNRFRATYIYGNTTIPDDIKRLTLMIAAKGLMHTVVLQKHVDGLNGFQPSMINVDEDEINKKIIQYRNYRASNI